jgi:hypothetical protein
MAKNTAPSESPTSVTQRLRSKIFNYQTVPTAILAEELLNRRTIPHQNRLEFLAPPFVSRQKVERKSSIHLRSLCFKTKKKRSEEFSKQKDFSHGGTKGTELTP